ncbi:hypothetical protein DL93DRAFT_2124690 [Clavulina sp. PMI_390]|nr:hypothetical protein DL93DRAFT_2124690 [Clavulina sp. PMI_390]
MRHLPHALLLLLSSLLQPTEVSALWPFPKKRFQGNALINAGSLGLDASVERIIAFGDFDGNQFLDVVSLSDDQHTLQIHLWNHEEFRFVASPPLTSSGKIVNAIPGDFDRDGKLDLLVMSESLGALDMSLYLGAPSGFSNEVVELVSAARAQPIPIDASGMMKIDLIGFLPSAGGSNSLILWNNTRVDRTSTNYDDFFKTTQAPFNGRVCDVSNPHSNAVVDFDGDCLSDVFLMCGTGRKYYQIWTNNKSNGFNLARSGALPPNVGAVTFADMDRDGTIDMIFPTCESISTSTGIGQKCKINIAYNQQKPLCASTNPAAPSKNCRLPDQLCSADSDFKFDFTPGSPQAGFTGSGCSPLLVFKAFTSIDVSSLFKDGTDSLLLFDTTFSSSLPIPLKVGDIDLDGFPDLVPIVVRPDGSMTPFVLLSHSCGSSHADGCTSSAGRTFKVLSTGTSALTSISDARSVAFLDIDEDGSWDILVQRTGRQNGQKMTFVQNNFFHDAFFLKAIVLNGACNGLCTPLNASEPKYHPFGVSYSGPTYKYTILDTTGRRSAAQVNQLPQTSYQALQTPYAFFGLGRTNNYIENLFVGSTKHAAEHFINMEGVIPNSRVVIIPPSKADVQGIQDWRRELYLRPGEWIPWVTLTVIVATIIMAIIVFFLHLNERREDELERRRKLHHINFDAL